jgi:hypothetical protein
LKPPERPKVSATAVEKGKTVDDPTTRIWSRASAAEANVAATSTAQASRLGCKGVLL